MGSLMRTQTLFFCLLVIIYACAILVSGNPFEECKAEIHVYYEQCYSSMLVPDADEPEIVQVASVSEVEDPDSISDAEEHELVQATIAKTPKSYFSYSIHGLSASLFTNNEGKPSYIGNYYGALYQSVQKQISNLNLKTPREFCNSVANGQSTSSSTLLQTANSNFEQCLQAISTLEVNRLTGNDHHALKGEEVFYNMYFFQTTNGFKTRVPFTQVILHDYMTYFHDTLWDELNEESFLKVEDYCANREKYPEINTWPYQYTK